MKVYPDDWRVRLSGAAGGMAGGAIGLFVVKPLIELPVWLGPFAFVALIGVGVILGNIIGGRLFRPSAGGPTDRRTIRPAPDLAQQPTGRSSKRPPQELLQAASVNPLL